MIVAGITTIEINESLALCIEAEKEKNQYAFKWADRPVAAYQLVVDYAAIDNPYGANNRDC